MRINIHKTFRKKHKSSQPSKDSERLGDRISNCRNHGGREINFYEYHVCRYRLLVECTCRGREKCRPEDQCMQISVVYPFLLVLLSG